jgi:hypothetical protein
MRLLQYPAATIEHLIRLGLDSGYGSGLLEVTWHATPVSGHWLFDNDG